MELVVFIGIQATGKTSFFVERFSRTHIRVSLDVVRTRHREERLVKTCLEIRQPCVVDNTNPTRADREKYLTWAREAEVACVGYYFRSGIAEALARNNLRQQVDRIPEKGVLGTHRRLEVPTIREGFTELHYVALTDAGFSVSAWCDEV